VISGLNEDDQVVLRPDASVAEGTKVRAEAVKPSTAKESPADQA
jgi:hypothetical protein